MQTNIDIELSNFEEGTPNKKQWVNPEFQVIKIEFGSTGGALDGAFDGLEDS